MSILSFSSDLVRGVHAHVSVERQSGDMRETRAAAQEVTRVVTHVVICMSRAFCLTDQEKRETACSLF